MHCTQCGEIIKPRWKGCPKCLVSFENCCNTTIDLLRRNVRQDVDNFLQQDSLWQGDKFIIKAAKENLFDWEWADALGWAEGHWFWGQCYGRRLIRIPNTTGQQEAEICDAKELELCHLAASKGFPPAENDFGYCLLQGRPGLQKNASEAFRFVQSAAEHGYLHAKYNLGSFYKCGHGVAKDEARAFQIHLEVAEQGFAPAQERLGSLYRFGRGSLPRDPSLAMLWFNKAADQGFAEGMAGIAALYYFGEGVPKNKRQAEIWFRRAAEKGHLEAQSIINREEKRFFPWKF